MKFFSILTPMLFFITAVFAQEPGTLANWKFRTGDNLAWAQPGFNDADWRSVRVGTNWEKQGYAGYNGYAWYRVRFQLPSSFKKDSFSDTLRFILGKIDDHDQTFLNGQLLGQNAKTVKASRATIPDLAKTPMAWDAIREYAIAANDPRLRWDAENVIAVRVYDEVYDGGMYSLPVKIAVKDIHDYLALDIDPTALQKAPDGSFIKTVTLKKLSPAVKIRGTLSMELSGSDNRSVAARNYEVNLDNRREASFTIRFKEDILLLKESYAFTQAGTGTAISHLRNAFEAPLPGAAGVSGRNSHYITNQSPLRAQPYTALPLGAIRAKGMLLNMLQRQQKGLTGHLDSIYNVVCGSTNGWLGGQGDGWERGPYWIDGLVPLAYQLDDAGLKAKAQQWIEWTIANQRPDGYFGPLPLPANYKNIPGTQQGWREDWWPKMVMLKVLQQYYTATGDRRVIGVLTRYFKYENEHLPEKPLGYWTFWGEQRGADNLAIVYWLYNITRDKFLLELGETIHRQTTDWTSIFSGTYLRSLGPLPDLHCVNVAQGLKAPVIYYQQDPDPRYLDAVKLGLNALRECHGFVNGMYGGDENLHGNDPAQGSELCSAVEMMYSFESVLPITGDAYYGDYLEKIAYNVLPTQSTDDYLRRQYFQQANQVQVTADERNFFNHRRTALVFGTTSGYPCCTANMHQGWPKFVQNLWYATADNGLAALVYGASEVTARVGSSGREVTITEQTDYPFKPGIRFTVHTGSALAFPLHLRIPLWCSQPLITVNGQAALADTANNIAIISRTWSDGDVVELSLPMEFRYSRWADKAIGIERGPLVYALKIEEDWQEKTGNGFEDTYWEVLPKTPWNYILSKNALDNGDMQLTIKDRIADNPWNLENAPVSVQTKASLLPGWLLAKSSAGRLASETDSPRDTKEGETTVTLVPYGCTTLRVSQFPVQ